MIDYIKVRLNQNGLPSNILQNPSLDFIKKYTKNQSIIWVAEYSKMKFEIYENSGIVDVSGSLHYLGNEGVHNWNDFSRIELRNTIFNFCTFFGIKEKETKIHSLEFGVNILLEYNPSDFLKMILSYKTSKLSQEIDLNKDILKADFKQYQLKIYNKGLQFDKGNILRFEFKTKKMTKISNISNCLTLNNIYSNNILEKLGNSLKKEFNELIVSEVMDTQKMTTKEMEKFEKMNNRSFWKSITDKNSRRTKKNTFNKLIHKYGNGEKRKILNQISEKWNELISSDFTKKIS